MTNQTPIPESTLIQYVKQAVKTLKQGKQTPFSTDQVRELINQKEGTTLDGQTDNAAIEKILSRMKPDGVQVHVPRGRLPAVGPTGWWRFGQPTPQRSRQISSRTP